jgi:hypothetical protein
MNTSLKYNTFSGSSHEKLKIKLGFLGIYGGSSFSIFSKLFSLDLAHHALDQARNLFINFSCFSIYSCSLL